MCDCTILPRNDDTNCQYFWQTLVRNPSESILDVSVILASYILLARWTELLTIVDAENDKTRHRRWQNFLPAKTLVTVYSGKAGSP